MLPLWLVSTVVGYCFPMICVTIVSSLRIFQCYTVVYSHPFLLRDWVMFLSVVFFSKIVADGWLQTFLCFVVFVEGLMFCFSADWPSYLMFVRSWIIYSFYAADGAFNFSTSATLAFRLWPMV